MAISFTTIPSVARVPLFYAELDNSLANTATTGLRTLLLGQMTEGKAEIGKPVLVTSDSVGKELFGRGSELARMNTAFRKNDAMGEVWAIPVEATGSKATGTITVSGTANEAGVISLYVGSERIQVAVSKSEGVEAIATAVKEAINAKPDLPVTAEAASGVVTVTAKNFGAIGSDTPIAVNLQGFAAGEKTPDGLAVEIQAMSGGTGAPDLSGLAQAMGDEAYDFILMPYADTASLDALKEIMNDQTGRWSPLSQLYGHVYAVKRGSIEDLQAFGAVRNNQHETVMGIEPATASGVCEVLGAFGAQNASKISIDPARPVQTLELIGIKSAPAGARFTLSERQILLTNGIATEYTESGAMRIERAITTYQKNAFGDADNSYLDSETLHTLAYVIRALRTRITSKYSRHKLANDDTRFGAGQAVVTPSIIRGELIAMYARLEEQALVENSELFAEHLIVERDVNDPNRINVLLPPDLVNQLRIFAVLNQFRLQYQ